MIDHHLVAEALDSWDGFFTRNHIGRVPRNATEDEKGAIDDVVSGLRDGTHKIVATS